MSPHPHPRNRPRLRNNPQNGSAPTKPPSDGFRCAHCGHRVAAPSHGTRHRNHCPRCLWSAHLDDTPGDRRSICGGEMRPVSIDVRPNGEWAVIHRCTHCGALKTNRIAGDDEESALLKLAMKPLANLPFPLE